MLSGKYCKLLITTNFFNSLNKSGLRNFNSNLQTLLKLQCMPATSYFSKLNLKEKHSAEFRKQKSQQNSINQKSSDRKSSEELLNQKTENMQTQNANVIKNKVWPSPIDALKDMKTKPKLSEIEVIQLNVGLNVDYRKGDQNVRGIFKMPGGALKTPKVVAFVPPELADKATTAGADFIGDSDTIKEIQNGQINFEKCVCTIEMLPMLKNVGRILGPLGLMPNAKIGTACTADKLENIIKDLKLGSKEFRVDPRGQIIVPVGKRDFSIENVLENIHSFMNVLVEKKPDSIKGRYFLYAFLSSRRLSYKIDMKTLDPKTNSYFMQSLHKPAEDTEKDKKAQKEAEKDKNNVPASDAVQDSNKERKEKKKNKDKTNKQEKQVDNENQEEQKKKFA